jgi:hypothetical protein
MTNYLTEAWNRNAGIKTKCGQCGETKGGSFYQCHKCYKPTMYPKWKICGSCRKTHETMHMLEELN